MSARVAVACRWFLVFWLPLTAACGGGVNESGELPEITEVWDYSDPAGSRARFEELARDAESAGDDVYHAEVMTQIARTYGLQGRFEEAGATLDEVAATESVGHPRVRVRLELERGRTLRSAGDPEAAKPHFIEAWELARESGEDFLAGDAAHMLALVAPLEEAAEWTARARTLVLESRDDTARHWLGALHNNLGWAYYGAEEYDSALAQFQLSFEDYSHRQGKEVEELIARYSIGKTLRAMGRHREAVETQEAVRLAFEARGEDDGYVFEELAEGYSALGEKARACEAAQKAYEILSAEKWFVENEAERLERLRELAVNCE